MNKFEITIREEDSVFDAELNKVVKYQSEPVDMESAGKAAQAVLSLQTHSGQETTAEPSGKTEAGSPTVQLAEADVRLPLDSANALTPRLPWVIGLGCLVTAVGIGVGIVMSRRVRARVA